MSSQVSTFRGAALRSRYVVPAVSVVCAAALCVSVAGQQQTPFKSGASTVAVYTTVTDSTGRLVPDLTKDDFEIYDNGKLQPITLFATETQPISRHRDARPERQHEGQLPARLGRAPRSSSSGCCLPTRPASAASPPRSRSVPKSSRATAGR